MLSIMRLRDTALLYLVPAGNELWQVVRILPSGVYTDPDLLRLRGCRVHAHAVMAWAAGQLSSAALHESRFAGAAW